jgi:hypothetical protein
MHSGRSSNCARHSTGPALGDPLPALGPALDWNWRQTGVHRSCTAGTALGPVLEQHLRGTGRCTRAPLEIHRPSHRRHARESTGREAPASAGLALGPRLGDSSTTVKKSVHPWVMSSDCSESHSESRWRSTRHCAERGTRNSTAQHSAGPHTQQLGAHWAPPAPPLATDPGTSWCC